MSIKSKIGDVIIDKAVDYVSGDPEVNIPKLLNMVDALNLKSFEENSQMIHRVLDDPGSNWYKFIMSLWTDLDSELFKSVLQNFILRDFIIGFQKQQDLAKELDCNIPLVILMDPTSACNLKCTGCWAAEYGDKLSMSYETLNEIVRQGKELSIYMYVYTGGEPLVRKADILRLCQEHPDCQFAAFTNGTLIDEAFAKEILRLKNFIPMLSLDGFEKETDARRGKGTFAKVMQAANILKENKILYAFSCTYTSENVDVLGSEEYFDMMIDKGAKFCWFFTYIPVGKEAVPELMASDEQRAFMYDQVRKFRETKPFLAMDFWNDGEHVGGCIAGGRRFAHINANGDIEPCAFVHYSDSSIYEKTLLEAFQSPLFKAYHDRQPFNQNHLRVCPLLDNPEKLREIIEVSGAKSTDLRNPEDVHELTAKCDDVAAKWALRADELWACAGHCAECGKTESQKPA